MNVFIFLLGYALIGSIACFILLVVGKKQKAGDDDTFFVSIFGGLLWPVLVALLPIVFFYGLIDKAATKVASNL